MIQLPSVKILSNTDPISGLPTREAFIGANAGYNDNNTFRCSWRGGILVCKPSLESRLVSLGAGALFGPGLTAAVIFQTEITRQITDSEWGKILAGVLIILGWYVLARALFDNRAIIFDFEKAIVIFRSCRRSTHLSMHLIDRFVVDAVTRTSSNSNYRVDYETRVVTLLLKDNRRVPLIETASRPSATLLYQELTKGAEAYLGKPDSSE